MKKSKRKFIPWISHLASEDIRVEHGGLELVEETRTEQKKHWVRNHITLTLLPILFLVIIFWVIASFYLPKIRVGDNIASAHQPDTALQNLIQQRASDYRLTIVYPDGSKKNFALQELGLHVDYTATIKDFRHRQHRFGSRLQWWHPTIVYLKTIADSTQLDSFIAREASVTIQPAKDATISIVNGSVQVSDSVAGKHYGLIDPIVTLTSVTSRLQSIPLKLQTLSTRPAISSKQLASSQTKLQQILNQTVVFTIGSKKIQASSTDIAGWIELTSKNSGRAVDVAVNSGKVLDYINKIAAGFVHPPKDQVVVVRSDGSTSVLISGVNGTDIVDKSTVAADVAQNLLAGKAIDETLTVNYAPYKTITSQAYNKWIEVDTTNKRLYAYEGSTLIQTFLISAGAPATPTVTGQFAIYAKYAQQDMYGQNVDGSSYFQPAVPWVNYFYGGYAIHGNYWRPLSYFGNINSSHGCVGLMVDDGQWVYSWAPIGTPVIVHT